MALAPDIREMAREYAMALLGHIDEPSADAQTLAAQMRQVAGLIEAEAARRVPAPRERVRESEVIA